MYNFHFIASPVAIHLKVKLLLRYCCVRSSCWSEQYICFQPPVKNIYFHCLIRVKNIFTRISLLIPLGVKKSLPFLHRSSSALSKMQKGIKNEIQWDKEKRKKKCCLRLAADNEIMNQNDYKMKPKTIRDAQIITLS